MDGLVCKNLTKKYGDKEAVKNINLQLEKGKIYGLIGRNGAGKTTLLSLISAQNKATEGTVEWNNQTVWENQVALSNICFAREINIGNNNTYLANFKVKDYLKTAALYYPNWNATVAKTLVEKFELNQKERLGRLSKGMLSMVTIIIAIASKAEFTFMDEPVAGLDVVARENFYRLLLKEYEETGRTFVISTHIIEEASDVFEEVIMIKQGELLLKENTLDLLERAYQVSGLAEEVDKATKGLEVHCVTKTGRGKNVTVLLKEGESLSEGYEVTVQPINLQNIFVALCGSED